MQKETQPKIYKEDKIAIAVAIVAFLTFSVLLAKSGNKALQETKKYEQVQKNIQQIKSNTLDLSK
ncbi:MAG: hypothetical protein IKZ34_02460 [Alphaproteobacteria bacterium]|jgi:uncharacterized protein YoxC|nr:hypothetical protein [Alphaproteobacteria bacterium]